MSKSVEVVTLGCRLNSFESQQIKENAENANLDDVIIVNTCSVTKIAEQDSIKTIKKLKKQNPNKKVIATGCAVQINPKLFEDLDEVDNIIGNDKKTDPNVFFNLNEERVKVNDIMEVKEISNHMVSAFDGHTRAFIQIQNGCDHRCTFCIIPYGRGNSRSVPMGEIFQQIKTLVASGYKEVVLTGVDISSYGGDLPGKPSLGNLVKRILINIPELQRLRLSSIDCIEIDEELFQVLENDERFLPHLHLSLQSGDDMILKRMARRHSSRDIIELCDRLRKCRPNLVIGADIITGFPTENDEMFKNTCEIIKRCNVIFLHVFPYSERVGTPAEKIPNKVPVDLRKKRASDLRKIGKKLELEFYKSQIGKVKSVLVENNNKGHAEDFCLVKINVNVERGQIIDVKIIDYDKNILIGEVINV